MNERKTVTVSFDTMVSLEDRGDHWAARIDPLGMFVYADTRADVEKRVQDAIDFC